MDDLIESGGIFVSRPLLKDEPKSDDELGRLLTAAVRTGWRQALDEVYSDQGFVRYVTSPERLSLITLLPLDLTQEILEIGPGYGQMSVELSRQVGRLDLIEADLGQARFCKIRTEQELCGNVRIFAGGEEGTLPLPNESYDGVVMNLVLEWCGVRSDRKHQDVQNHYLSEVHRVLKPGGFFFVSTKNRYALRLLTGGRDEHLANMPFGSALPRSIGALIAGKRTRGFLHSYSTLERMLVSKGFELSDSFLALPDMRWPKSYLSYSALSKPKVNELIGDMPKRPRAATKLVPLPLMKFVAPGLTFLLKKAR
jgi:SAM-dependent methyltransferase